MSQTESDIVSRFRRSYILALTLTALSLLLLIGVVQLRLRSQEQDAHFVNLAGRQRMLSQRMTKQALLCREEPVRWTEQAKVSLQEFEEAHQQLLSRQKNRETERRMAAVDPVKWVLSSAIEKFLAAPSDQSLSAVLNAEREFLENMERLVQAFEDEASERVQFQKRLQWGILVFLLLVLLLEALTIFRPLVGSLTETLNDLRGVRLESEKALEKALESERLKSAFLANISHEIRTPLNGILGSLQLMSRSGLKSEEREHLDTVSRSGEALVRIVDDILVMSMIQSGQLQLISKAFSPTKILNQVAQSEGLAAKSSGLELKISVDDNVPAWVVGDPDRVLQVLFNLVNNAVKFTEKGEVRLCLCSTPQGLKFQVEDTGPGIPKEQLSAALTPFRQLDSGNERSHQGTGLGLPICFNLLKLMGSHLEAGTSREGGALFSFVLDLEAVDSAELPVGKPAVVAHTGQFYSGRVLVVEDLPMNQKVARRMLEKFGLETESALDGQQALDILEKESFDLVLMDLQMPVMDGLEATRRLRAREDSTPIVALTANAEPESQERCLAAGMNDYMTKPVRLSRLREVLARFLESSPS